ncbi:unnamed protein product [Camellia sinensis]
MDKSWIALGCTVDGRISQPYFDGVISFLHFAMAVIDRDGKILCPCRKCVNVVRQNFQIVQIHLLQHGIISTYTIWHMHGEPRESKCGQSLSTHTYRLRIKYLNLKSAKGEEYARSHPPPECDLEKWKNLIEGKWNDTNWLKQSKANIDNRKPLKTKHRCGSKSIPVRTIANGGQLPELPRVYKSTHFNDVTKQWISSECEKNYDNMIKIQAEHCSQPSVVPTTPEELSVKLLKPRSGYVKGLGLRPSFSVGTTSASTNIDYVRHLQMEIQEQNEEIQLQKEEITTQQHEIQAQKEEIQAQNNVIGKMNESIEEHLDVTSSIMEFLKKQSFKRQFRG